MGSGAWRTTAVEGGYAVFFVVVGAAATVIAPLVAVAADDLVSAVGVGDADISDGVVVSVSLGAFLLPAFIVGRFARRDVEVWCFGLGSFLAFAVLGMVEVLTVGDVGIGEVIVVGATIALAALVACFAGYSMAMYGDITRRGRQPRRARPFEAGGVTGPHASIEQALGQIARSGGKTVVGDLDHWGKPDPPLPTEVLVFSSASRLCGRVTSRADQREDLLRLGWRSDTGGLGPAPGAAATPVFFEREWDMARVGMAEVANDLREVLRLAGPVRHDALVPLEVEVEDERSDLIEPEGAGYGSLIGGPMLVIAIAVVLGIVTVFFGERAVDPLLLGIGVAMLAVLLVSSLGRWLIPRLPGISSHADDLWWASLLLLPPLAAIGSYLAELVALG